MNKNNQIIADFSIVPSREFPLSTRPMRHPIGEKADSLADFSKKI